MVTFVRTAPSTPNPAPPSSATGKTAGANSAPARASGKHQPGSLIRRPSPRLAPPPRQTGPQPTSFPQSTTDAQWLTRTVLPPLTVDNAISTPLRNMMPLRELQGALDKLRAACSTAGAGDAFEQLAAALTRVGDLPARAAKAHSHEEHDAVVAQLQVHVESATQAIARGRDGAALINLYGQNAALDTAIDTLRTYATTRMLEVHGAGKTAAPQAQSLVKQERAIAEGRLEIQRLLAKESGFAPPLGILRIDSSLAEGLARANPDVVRRTGILLGSVLARQRELANSPSAQDMRAAMQKLQAATPSRQDAAYLQQRTAALVEQPLATGLKDSDLARLKIGGASPNEVAGLLKALTARRLSGAADGERLLCAADRTPERAKPSHTRLTNSTNSID